MHLFHEWEKVVEKKGHGTIQLIFSSTVRRVPIIYELWKCRKCPKMKATATEFDGGVHNIDPRFINWEEGKPCTEN